LINNAYLVADLPQIIEREAKFSALTGGVRHVDTVALDQKSHAVPQRSGLFSATEKLNGELLLHEMEKNQRSDSKCGTPRDTVSILRFT